MLLPSIGKIKLSRMGKMYRWSLIQPVNIVMIHYVVTISVCIWRLFTRCMCRVGKCCFNSYFSVKFCR